MSACNFQCICIAKCRDWVSGKALAWVWWAEWVAGAVWLLSTTARKQKSLWAGSKLAGSFNGDEAPRVDRESECECESESAAKAALLLWWVLYAACWRCGNIAMTIKKKHIFFLFWQKYVQDVNKAHKHTDTLSAHTYRQTWRNI